MAEQDEESARPVDALGAAPTLPAGGGGGRGRGGAGGRGGGGNGGRSPRRSRRVGLVPLVIVLVVALALAPTLLSSLKKTPRNRVGISYGGGPIEGVHFQKTVQPGSGLFFNGLFDQLFLYPSDQQNYIISKAASQGAIKGADSVSAPSSDRVQVQYQVAAFFKLNIDKLRQFHEQLGLRYRAYTGDGWASLLQDTLRQQIESALQVETRKRTVSEIIGSAQVLSEIQSSVQKTISEQLVTSLGEEYFCSPAFAPGRPCDPITFFIKRVDVSPTVQAAFEDVARRTNERDAIDILNEALSKAGQNYVLLKAVEAGTIPMIVLTDGEGNVNVNIPTSPGSTPTTTTPAGGGTDGGSSGSTTTTTTAPG
jgi:regulator of protease activity HflC (stomatin/prohibitin superfamily)